MKKYINLFLIVTAIVSNVTLNGQIIPAPQSITPASGHYTIDSRTKLVLTSNDPSATKTINIWRTQLAEQLGLDIMLTDKVPMSQFIQIEMSALPIAKEGYELDIQPTVIKIKASSTAGVQYALTSLSQLLPAAKTNKSITIPCQKIADSPRFGWRGLMLDVSRHFFTVEEVKQYIDQMAVYKFNTFHWHLTDDEGWRVEIKSLPKLTEVGAWRVERHGKFGSGRSYPKAGEKATYGGFYTQDQIRDVVQYAMDRHITIVPEVDIPGHSMAALAAYPELSTGKTPKFVNPGSKFAEWYAGGKFEMLIENTLNPADEKVYEFVDKVMTELALLFPGEYIHMGGDECYKGYWEKSPEVQAFMKKNKLADSHELQSYFVKRVDKMVSAKGKKLIGWDEILEGGLSPGAAVMSWRGMKGGIEAAKMGHKVVMSPTTHAYLDYTQGDRSVETNIYSDLTMEKCYELEPVPEGIDPSLILGGQGNLWTEAIPKLDFAMYMTYPRALALAEVFWSPASKKNWPDFVQRVETHIDRFDAQGISIAKVIYDPSIKADIKDSTLTVVLSSHLPDAEIWYSIDNTYPLDNALLYNGTLTIPKGELYLRTQLYRHGSPIGRMLMVSREELVKRANKK